MQVAIGTVTMAGYMADTTASLRGKVAWEVRRYSHERGTGGI